MSLYCKFTITLFSWIPLTVWLINAFFLFEIQAWPQYNSVLFDEHTSPTTLSLHWPIVDLLCNALAQFWHPTDHSWLVQSLGCSHTHPSLYPSRFCWNLLKNNENSMYCTKLHGQMTGLNKFIQIYHYHFYIICESKNGLQKMREAFYCFFIQQSILKKVQRKQFRKNKTCYFLY